MEFDVNKWLETLTGKVLDTFGGRVLYIGQTGSFARGEATAASDIDVNIVLDCLSMDDLKKYRKIIHDMPHSEKACGFICGKDEMAAWPRHEMFQFTKGCKVLYGSLENLAPPMTDKDIWDDIKFTASAIYHMACHMFLYCDEICSEAENLKGVYKPAFYILQQWYYLKIHRYIPAKKELLPLLEGKNRDVLSVILYWDSLKDDRRKRPEYYFNLLKDWSGNMLKSTE